MWPEINPEILENDGYKRAVLIVRISLQLKNGVQKTVQRETSVTFCGSLSIKAFDITRL